MKLLTISAALLVALASVVPVLGTHTDCNGTIIAVETPVTTLYIEDRSNGPGEINHWVYLESNAVHGLQTGGHIDLLQESWEPELGDPCRHSNPDTTIF